MAKKKLILHIGYPKTATTTLQGNLLEKCQEINYLGKFVGETPKKLLFPDPIIQQFRDIVNNGNSLQVRKMAPYFFEQIHQKVLEADKTTVISAEGFMNPIVDTHYVPNKDIFLKAKHIFDILNHGTHEQVETQILITVREQVDLVPSFFSQSYFQGRACGFYGKTYESFLDFLFEDNFQGFGPIFKYDEVADYYCELFGSENVIVLSMKDLLASSVNPTTEKMAELLSIDTKTLISMLQGQQRNTRKVKGGSKPTYRLMPPTKAIRKAATSWGFSAQAPSVGIVNRLRQALGRELFLSISDYSDRIRAYYAMSNHRLQEKYGIFL